jgi:hypothetical protein
VHEANVARAKRARADNQEIVGSGDGAIQEQTPDSGVGRHSLAYASELEARLLQALERKIAALPGREGCPPDSDSSGEVKPPPILSSYVTWLEEVTAFRTAFTGERRHVERGMDLLTRLTDDIAAWCQAPGIPPDHFRKALLVIQAFRFPDPAARPSLRELDSALENCIIVLHNIEPLLANPNQRPASAAATSKSQAKPTHSEDFTSVNWYGELYSFSKGQQAEVVKLLWAEYEKGEHGLSAETLAEKLDSQAARFRVRDVFRRKGAMHPAWGKTILQIAKGVYALHKPEKRKTPK